MLSLFITSMTLQRGICGPLTDWLPFVSVALVDVHQLVMVAETTLIGQHLVTAFEAHRRQPPAASVVVTRRLTHKNGNESRQFVYVA